MVGKLSMSAKADAPDALESEVTTQGRPAVLLIGPEMMIDHALRSRGDNDYRGGGCPEREKRCTCGGVSEKHSKTLYNSGHLKKDTQNNCSGEKQVKGTQS